MSSPVLLKEVAFHRARNLGGQTLLAVKDRDGFILRYHADVQAIGIRREASLDDERLYPLTDIAYFVRLDFVPVFTPQPAPQDPVAVPPVAAAPAAARKATPKRQP